MDYSSLDEEKARVVIKDLVKKGWVHVRSSGSHHAFQHPKSKQTIIVPHHGLGTEISPGVHKIIKKQSTVFEDAVGTASAIPAVNTQSTGEAEISANPPVKKKKRNLLTRTMPMTRPPKSLRDIVGRDMKNDVRADKR